MRSSIRIFSISGIEVGIHPTWFIAFGLITWIFATSFLPRQSPGWTQAEYWIAGVAASALLFGSVLVHELAHSFTARFLGLSVQGITLFLFGGVSRIGGDIRHASTEFFVAFAGPASSLAIGGVCMLIASQFNDGPGPQPLSIGILSVLGYMNIFIGAFNLLPGHPLDGGRVLRSIVWAVTKNPALAGRVASMSGRVVAFGMMALGAYWLLQGDSLGGLWIIFLAMFLLGSASEERRQLPPTMHFGARVTDALMPTPAPAGHTETLDSVARRHFLDGSFVAVPVARDGELIGFVESWDARRVNRVDWPALIVGDIVEPRGFTITEPQAPALQLLKRLSLSDHRVAAVFDGPEYLGVVTIDSLAAALNPSQDAV